MEGVSEIFWNGAQGRTLNGREFRKSDDGSVYERVGNEYVPFSEKGVMHTDLDSIQWEGERGRTVKGRQFRKSGKSIYEYLNGEWKPIYKPEVEGKEEIIVQEEASEEVPQKKSVAAKSTTPAQPKSDDARPPMQEAANARVQRTASFLDKLAQKSNRFAGVAYAPEMQQMKIMSRIEPKKG